MTGQQGEREALAERALALAHFNDSVDHGVIDEWVNADGFKAGRFTTDDLRALAALAAQPPRVTPSAEAIRRAITDADDEFDRLDPSAEADWGDWEAEAILALFAAQPTVQQVREQVAAEIEAQIKILRSVEQNEPAKDFTSGLARAARIARGEKGGE